MIHGPFWNLQALSELLLSQSNKFNGIAECRLDDELGVTREILQDEIYIALDPEHNQLRRTLTQHGIDDAHFGKLALVYGIVLDFANVQWTDAQLASLAIFQLQPADAGHR